MCLRDALDSVSIARAVKGTSRVPNACRPARTVDPTCSVGSGQYPDTATARTMEDRHRPGISTGKGVES